MDKLIKCIWITNTVAAAGEMGITLRELNRKWTSNPENDPFPERTFHRMKEYIADVFGIDIECDKSRNSYYIPYREELYDDKLKMWLLNSFGLHSRLSGDLDLRSRVQFEKVPGGTQWLDPIVEAMQQFRMITFRYQKNYEQISDLYPNCSPLALKLFKQRWYLIALTQHLEMRFYALDRLLDLQINDEHFDMPTNFNINELFCDAFGMYVNPEISVECIVVKSDIEQSKYLKSLPLHPSQFIIEETDDYVIFSWRLKPTYDFIQQLLTMSIHIEVLEPQTLRQKMAELLKTMVGKYKQSPKKTKVPAKQK